jgi:phage terminase large subunit
LKKSADSILKLGLSGIPIRGKGPAAAFEGAYFAKHLERARQEGRICRVSVDPMLSVKAFFDIGGAGFKSDAMAIWLCQFVGREV